MLTLAAMIIVTGRGPRALNENLEVPE